MCVRVHVYVCVRLFDVVTSPETHLPVLTVGRIRARSPYRHGTVDADGPGRDFLECVSTCGPSFVGTTPYSGEGVPVPLLALSSQEESWSPSGQGCRVHPRSETWESGFRYDVSTPLVPDPRSPTEFRDPSDFPLDLTTSTSTANSTPDCNRLLNKPSLPRKPNPNPNLNPNLNSDLHLNVTPDLSPNPNLGPTPVMFRIPIPSPIPNSVQYQLYSES